MMTRSEWEKNVRWWALEVADAQGQLVPLERRAEATALARGGLTAAQIDSERLEPATVAFLRKRMLGLEERAVTGPELDLLSRLKLPVLPTWLAASGWVLALTLGFAMTQLGNERQLNLLALPLIGLLLWNGVVMAASLVVECWPRSSARPVMEPGWLDRLSGWLTRRDSRRSLAGTSQAAVEAAFGELAGGTGQRLLQRRFRAWLHVAAALVAVGSITAMFARGWSREYRVVWESTLLDAPAAGRFFGGLFGPASRVLGVPIPLDQVPAMQRGEGHQTTPSAALPWLQLYGGTMLLGVVIPRLLLSLVAVMRARQELRGVVLRQGWSGFAIKLLRRGEGGDQQLLVLAPGQLVDERVRSRWEDWLRELFGGRVRLDVRHLPEGEEDEWLSQWQPEDGRAVVVFFMASTPEDEVQVHLVRQLSRHLEEQHFEPEITLLLDAMALDQRWPPERLAEREALWRGMVGALVQKMVVASEKGVSEVRRDLS